MLFKDRMDAGQQLAHHLTSYTDHPDVMVVALPRGGVPVAAEIAEAIHAPLDVLVVRKLGVPGAEETAMGAIASGDFRYLNQGLVNHACISPGEINATMQKEQQELQRRERAYRDDSPPLDLRDRTVILVDDGLATGATIQVAIAAAKQQQPRELTVAVPVAEPDICDWIGEAVDHIVCAATPRPFYAVGHWYKTFSQTSDDEVRTLLRQARSHPSETANRSR